MEQIDGYCNSFKLKYMYLDKLFNGRLDTRKNGKQVVDTVNIFINFESLYNIIRRRDIEKYIATATKKEIRQIYRQCISGFINVAAHYREYFNRHKISTNIIYFYNEISEDYIEYNNTAFIPEYRHHFIESLTSLDRLTVNSLIADSIPFMNIITEYLDGIHMVGSKRVEASLIPYTIYMQNVFPANLNIVITKDEFDYQYCNKNFIIVSKYCNEPVLLTKYNIMRFLRHKLKYNEDKTDTGIREPIELNPLLIPFIYSFLGNRKRSIPKIKKFGFSTIYKALEKLCSIGYILNDEPDTMSAINLCEILNTYGNGIFRNEELKEVLLTNYKAYDLDYQYSVESKSQIENILDQLTNKVDPQALMDINDKYFEFCPLMLLELNRYDKKDEIRQYL